MAPGITRRAFATGVAAMALAGRPSIAARAARPERITGIDLSRHPVPFPPNLAEVCELDQRWLDEQARRYWDDYAQHLGRPLTAYDQADFWFRYLAQPLQEKAMLGGSLDTGRRRIEKDLALIHMVGYYGGLWFGKKLDEFAGTSTTAQCAQPDPEPTPADFESMALALRRAVDTAREGSDAAVVDAAEIALRGGDLAFYLSNGLPTLNGLIGAYSYNVGYTNAILVPDNRALPPPVNPAGPTPYDPPWNAFEFTSNGVFDATYPVWADPATAATTQPVPPDPAGFTPVPYLTGEVPALRLSRPLFERAAAEHAAEFERIRAGFLDRSGAPALRGDLNVQAQAAFNTGTATWTAVPTLDIRRWDAPSYHLLVALSIFFVQAMQAPGQACMAAAAAGDPLAARNALLTSAIAMPFGMSYLVSLGRGNSGVYACYTADQSIPPFVLG